MTKLICLILFAVTGMAYGMEHSKFWKDNFSFGDLSISFDENPDASDMKKKFESRERRSNPYSIVRSTSQYIEYFVEVATMNPQSACKSRKEKVKLTSKSSRIDCISCHSAIVECPRDRIETGR